MLSNISFLNLIIVKQINISLSIEFLKNHNRFEQHRALNYRIKIKGKEL